MDRDSFHLVRPLERIAEALERLAPAPAEVPRFDAAGAWIWRADPDRFEAVDTVNRVALELLRGIDRMKGSFVANLRQFARGNAANNVLLWGARGMGKSALVKAAHAHVAGEPDQAPLVLVEIDRGEIGALHRLLEVLRCRPDARFLLFCDDLAFEAPDNSYRALKAVLDGGIADRPPNVLFCATSNRRHLMPREMIENERQTAINPSEATEEKVSLSDRFGLWLGFHPCSQDAYLEMVSAYCAAYGIAISPDNLRAEAIAWRQARGSISGRVAWQLVCQLAGARNIRIP